MDWQPKNADLAGVLRRERRDDLTGLLSMMDFMERADREITRGPATFLYFNVENFHLMNREYGFRPATSCSCASRKRCSKHSAPCRWPASTTTASSS